MLSILSALKQRSNGLFYLAFCRFAAMGEANDVCRSVLCFPDKFIEGCARDPIDFRQDTQRRLSLASFIASVCFCLVLAKTDRLSKFLLVELRAIGSGAISFTDFNQFPRELGPGDSRSSLGHINILRPRCPNLRTTFCS